MVGNKVLELDERRESFWTCLKQVLGQVFVPSAGGDLHGVRGGQLYWPVQMPQVVIEVKATGYPFGNLLLKFVEEKSDCVGLTY